MIEATKPKVQTNSASPSSHHAGESRFDPVTGNWTLFAPHRSERPDEFVESRERIRNAVECPFCPGNETTTFRFILNTNPYVVGSIPGLI